MAFTEDLDVFVNTNEFAVPVVLGTGDGTVATTGIEDFADDVVLDDNGRAGLAGRVRTVLVPTAKVVEASLAEGDAVTVSGTAYTVNLLLAESDGAFTRLALRG